MADWERVADQLAEAIRLTCEHLGEDALPAIPGWSWFDAMETYKAAKAAAHGARSEEDRIRDAMAEAKEHPGRIVTR